MKRIVVLDWNGEKIGSWTYKSLKEFNQAIKEGHYEDVNCVKILEVSVDKNGKEIKIKER